jgi:PKD domain
MSGNGRAWYQSEGCGNGGVPGPTNDPTCSGTSGVPGVPDAGMFTPGTKYDMYNRNLALKAKQFQFAASLGIGAVAQGVAIGTDGGPSITGILWGTGVPTIPAADIQATPNSQNCAVCHARDDNTPGFPGMMAMRFGYGNYALINPAGTALDQEKGTTGTNDVLWFELGCKTGMGKRTQKTGAGPNADWGMSMFNAMFGLNRPAGTPVKTEDITSATLQAYKAMGLLNSDTVSTKERIPDQDVHDAAGMQCATCHYALGSLQGGTYTAPAKTVDGIAYPAETIEAMDHQFAQFGTMEDTFSKMNLDGTISCESCHTTRDNPRLVENGGTLVAPTPTHSSFPAFHIQKISCTTCHIPEVYAAPGRLKYRDYSLGYWKQGADVNGGWRNILDWNYDLITGSHKPIPVLHEWVTRNGKTQIVPILPSTIPLWEVANANSATEKGSETAVQGKLGSCDSTDASHAGQKCATNADCGNGTCNNPSLDMSDLAFFGGNPGLGTSPAPANALDTVKAALAVEALSNDSLRRAATTKNEINGANMIPLFDGFTQADSWAVDTKARLNAMVDAGAGTEMRIFQAARFDVTHGVVPKEWALGGTNRGGCLSCHSSMDPNSPNYSKYSVGFFEGYQQPIENAGMGIGQYDLIKNWFALFADYDCTAYCGMGSQDDSAFFDPAGNVITGAACSAGSPFQNIDQCVGYMQQTFDKAMGFPSGTAKMMGLNDGIAGLQGFTVRETVSGATLGCNPFAGADSMSPMPGYSVNNCMPDTFNAGTCINIDPNTHIGMCDSSSFRYKGMCTVNSDCNGTIADSTEKAKNPNGLLYTRAEIRDHFKIQLQQATSAASNTDHHNELTWPIAVERNPDNPSQVGVWDQAGTAKVCGEFQNQYCCTDPATGLDTPCTDGMNVKTTIHENQLLGYPQDRFDKITNPELVNCASCHTETMEGIKHPVSAGSSSQFVSAGAPSQCAGCHVTLHQGSVDLDATCGQCHYADATGTTKNGAPLMDKTYIEAVAPGMHGTSSAPPIAAVLNGDVAGVTVSDFTVSFTDNSTGSSSLAVTVNWGDGNVSTGAGGSAFSHTYGQTGTFNILITARDEQGRYSTHFVTGVVVPNVTNQKITGTVSGYSGFDASNTNIYLKQNGITKKILSTAADGLFTFNTAPGSYTVQAYKYGVTFSPENIQTVPVSAGSDSAVTFTAVQTKFSLDVTTDVSLGDGAVVIVKFNGVTKGINQTTGGEVSFKNLTAGSYTVTAYKRGYTCTDRTTVLSADDSVVVSCTANP